jgi:hypothetical protein
LRALRVDPKHGVAHSFISPDSGPASVQTEVLKRKVEEFYIVAFREYGNAAAQKTATEVRQDVSAGVGAFLQMLKAGVDDGENEVLHRVAQVEFHTDKTRWFVNKVERSETFVPTDVNMIITQLKDRYFDKMQPLPLGKTGLLNIAKQIAEYDGIKIDETELEGALMVHEMQRLVDLFKDLPIPAEVRVNMTLDLLVMLGKIDPKAKAKMDDGSEKDLLEIMKEKMLELAQADDDARKRMAQPLDFGPTPGGDPSKQGPPVKKDDEE